MKHFTLIIAAILALIAAPALASHHEKGGHGDHGQMQKAGHDSHAGMTMEAGTSMLGDQTAEGVKAVAHLRDVKAAMAKMGMKETHHFMVAFVGKDGKQITAGTVAVKMQNPAGTIGEAIPLMGMQEHFGADIVLAEKGKYTFKVGTKLPDGVVRQYEFKYEVK